MAVFRKQFPSTECTDTSSFLFIVLKGSVMCTCSIKCFELGETGWQPGKGHLKYHIKQNPTKT